jgi:hypothetical protein
MIEAMTCTPNDLEVNFPRPLAWRSNPSAGAVSRRRAVIDSVPGEVGRRL